MNKVFLIGNLTKDPELSTTSNNLSVCKFTIAVTRRFNSGTDGGKEADFFPIICWRGQAENCGRYLRKGSKVGICGSVQIRNYEAGDGSRRYVTEVIADEVQFLSSKNGEPDEMAAETISAPEVSAVPAKKARTLTPVEDVELPF